MDDLEMDRSLSEDLEPEKSRLTGWDVLNNAIVGGSLVGVVWAIAWLIK